MKKYYLFSLLASIIVILLVLQKTSQKRESIAPKYLKRDISAVPEFQKYKKEAITEKPKTEKKHKESVTQWTTDFIQAYGENRSALLNKRLEELKKNGSDTLPEIIRELHELPLHHQTARVSLFLALGEIAPTVSEEGRQEIKTIVREELKKPEEEKVSLDPETVDLHHDTRFTQKKDGIYLSNVAPKLAALDTLRTMSDQDSIQKLIEIAKDPHQPAYLRNAADDAILSFLDPAKAAKIKSQSQYSP